ncbi:hypothetical protein [Bacteroides stercoris]|uniref:hypothetical protein n=2 Tax=Bacteroides stercoris TaxID=46506 RepID=UPI0022E2C6C5|nr:hypothetical protein [Bacteroides stercoris]
MKQQGKSMKMNGNIHLKHQVRTDGQAYRSAGVLTYIHADVLTYRRTTAHRWGTGPRPP